MFNIIITLLYVLFSMALPPLTTGADYEKFYIDFDDEEYVEVVCI